MTHALILLMLAPLAPAPQATTMADEIKREEARGHYRTGERLMTEEAFEAAVREFGTAGDLDPMFVLAHYSKGQALMALKRYPEAVEAYTDARQTILQMSTMDQKAKAEYERQRRDEINDLEDSLQRLRAGKIKGASPGTDINIEQRLRFLREAQMRGAETDVRIPAELSLALGSAHFRLGRLEDAERHYRAAIESDQKLGAAHNNLAVICMLTGRFDEAKIEVKAAEKAGFAVSPRFKDDLKEREKAAKKAEK